MLKRLFAVPFRVVFEVASESKEVDSVKDAPFFPMVSTTIAVLPFAELVRH